MGWALKPHAETGRRCPECQSPLRIKLNVDICTNDACKYIYFWRY